MLERLKGVRDALDDLDDKGVMPGPFRICKFADVVYDLCRDFEVRLIEIERKIEAVEAYQREQSGRYS